MGHFIDLTGQKFGKLTILGRKYTLNNKMKWECLCECGNYSLSDGWDLKRGHTTSCGCFRLKRIKEANTKHGQSNRSFEYNSWHMMKVRCYNKKSTEYKSHGGRGIKVCERWLGENGFINFFNDMGKRPSKEHSLDRFPNNNGNYEVRNCRWATEEQQNRNKRNNIWIEYKGERKVRAEWAKELKVSQSNLKRMLEKKDFHDTYSFYFNRNLKKIS